MHSEVYWFTKYALLKADNFMGQYQTLSNLKYEDHHENHFNIECILYLEKEGDLWVFVMHSGESRLEGDSWSIDFKKSTLHFWKMGCSFFFILVCRPRAAKTLGVDFFDIQVLCLQAQEKWINKVDKENIGTGFMVVWFLLISALFRLVTDNTWVKRRLVTPVQINTFFY